MTLLTGCVLVGVYAQQRRQGRQTRQAVRSSASTYGLQARLEDADFAVSYLTLLTFLYCCVPTCVQVQIAPLHSDSVRCASTI